MKEPCVLYADSNGNPVVQTHEIQPYLKLCLDIIRSGETCLPLYLQDPIIGGLATKALKVTKPGHPEILANLVEKEILKIMPKIPDLPPFKIV